jgi:hypothetical protein
MILKSCCHFVMYIDGQFIALSPTVWNSKMADTVTVSFQCTTIHGAS